MSKTNIDYNQLLGQVLSHPTYSSYQQISEGRYRDYSESDNPKTQLTQFGLYDYSLGKMTKSLVEIAKELGILNDFSNKTPPDFPDKSSKVSEMSQKLAKIQERLENKERWYERHWPVIQKYFEGRKIIGLDPEFYRLTLHAIAQKFTPKNSKETTYEIIIPVYSSPAQDYLVQLHKIQINPVTGQKLGKKLQGKAYDESRGIWLPATSTPPHLQKTKQVMIFEGLEDALSVYLALQEQDENKLVIWDFLVTCGTGYFNHAARWLEAYCQGYDKKTLILDNDGPISAGAGAGAGKGASAKASLAFGPGPESGVVRFLPVQEGKDANTALIEGGIDGVWQWLKETNKNIVSRELIETQIQAEIEKEDIICENNVRAYHFTYNPLSDMAAAHLVLQKYQKIIRVAPDNTWFVYDPTQGIWDSKNSKNKLRTFISNLYPAYQREFERRKPSLSDGQIRAWLEFMASLGSSSRQNQVINTLPSEPIYCDYKDFDATPHYLNCLNGVLNMQTGELLPHSPELMQSKQANALWDKTAKCPLFDKFLQEITCNDKELLFYKIRQLGYCLSAETRERCFFFHIGNGKNGKTVESDLLLELLGTYAKSISPSLFCSSYGYEDKELYELAALPGVRLVVSSETNEKQSWSETALKRYSGGDTITARAIRQSPFTYKPVFKIIIHGNNKPKMSVGDSAIWNRLHMIPYDFTPKEQDTKLLFKLLSEKSGILTRLQQGYKEWHLSRELNPPERVKETKEEYQQEVFLDLQTFLESCCILEEKIETPFTEIYEEYEQFCHRHHKKSRSTHALGRWLGDQKIQKRKSNGLLLCSGIRLVTIEEKTAKEFSSFGNLNEEDEDLM
jgi:P4 family phage/plasmid primase-like protien